MARSTACGHTKEQFPHWMQASLSHTAMISLMLRFS